MCDQSSSSGTFTPLFNNLTDHKTYRNVLDINHVTVFSIILV
jgi:hypothetical protein